MLADHAVLKEFGVTAAGFTRATIQHNTGPPTYCLPEYLVGRPYTIQGDIYGLGILLYRLVTAKPLDPLAPDWERAIADPLLRDDIADCVDGDPARRLPSAADLAERLMHLHQRRAEIAERERLTRATAARIEAEAAARAAEEEAKRQRVIAERERALAEQAQRAAAEAQDAVETARSDRLVAEEKLRAGEEQVAFAYLARFIEYDPRCILAGEKAVTALNDWHQCLPTIVLSGHKGKVLNAQFSLDGTRIVTASGDQAARVWNCETGKALTTVLRQEGGEMSAWFDPNGRAIVTVSGDNTARVWDVITGQVLATLNGHNAAVLSAQFSEDGTRIITTSVDNTVRIWSGTSGRPLAILAGHNAPVLRAQSSRDSGSAVTASEDGTARVWETEPRRTRVTLARDGSGAASAQFNGNGMRVVTA